MKKTIERPNFKSFGLSQSIYSAVEDAGFKEPTDVQLESIPAIMNDKDVLARAETGSGKTAAFVLPILEDKPLDKSNVVGTLILVPTRELAIQIREEFEKFSINMEHKVKCLSVFGGVKINPQMIALRGGADVLVATPGRLLDLEQKRGLTAVAMHGNQHQYARANALKDFKAGTTRVLIATDVAGRGIDIEQLACVINYELPRSPNDYTHRVGRTGRAGEKGTAISLISHQEFQHFRVIEKRIGLKLEREQIEGFEADAVAPEIPDGVKSKKKKPKKGKRPALAKKKENAKKAASKKKPKAEKMTLEERKARYGKKPDVKPTTAYKKSDSSTSNSITDKTGAENKSKKESSSKPDGSSFYTRVLPKNKGDE
ncbi:UNVERIFIED_CONTAM: hypothetical protein GTU68_038216 [Idotea baltica]|nr:hypothetical protein [Idotea baltica]